MPFRASALNKGALVAAICVVLVVSWAGEPAQGSPSSCAIHRCISECPSRCNDKAASSCKGAKSGDVARYRRGCIKACTETDSCHSAGETICDCDSKCDGYCESPPSSPSYDGCVSEVVQSCKESCEKGCKGEKVNN